MLKRWREQRRMSRAHRRAVASSTPDLRNGVSQALSYIYDLHRSGDDTAALEATESLWCILDVIAAREAGKPL